MRALINFIKTMWSYHQVRYLFVAGTTTVVYMSIIAVGLWLNLHYMVAILAAQVLCILGAFPFYRGIVFESSGNIKTDFVKFLSVWSTAAIVGIVSTPFLVEFFGVHPLVAQIASQVFVSVGSYLAHRFFSFRKNTLKQSAAARKANQQSSSEVEESSEIKVEVAAPEPSEVKESSDSC